MPKVFGMHEIELQPGVESEDYERFFAEELAPTLKLPGWKTHTDTGHAGRVPQAEPLVGWPLRGISSRFIVLMTVNGDGRQGRSAPVELD